MNKLLPTTCLTLGAAISLFSQPASVEINLLSLQEGTLPIQKPANYGGWTAESMLDDSPQTGWACENGKVKGNVFVFEMLVPAVLERFEFDNASIDSENAAAKDLLVEVSNQSSTSGFSPVLRTTLKDRTDRQRFDASAKTPGRWVRLSILSNYGSPEWVELFSFRGFGKRNPVYQPSKNISGAYDSSYSKFHVRQQGTALTGCYEYNEGLLNGIIEGRLMKLTWTEGENQGPAVMVFSEDGNSFHGYWWHANQDAGQPAGEWDGTKTGSEVGSCPHWSGSVGGELEKGLSSEGRVRLYGILFDLDSATIRPESKPVLDEVLGVLKEQPGWRLTIEGHTDSSGGEAHNLKLSQSRAESVKAYLVAGGIDGSRLTTTGFGASKPVADNATELGRAQNRRVELVRN